MGDIFTGLADRYEDWFTNNSELFESELRLLKMIISPFSRGFEIGVGTGIFANALGITSGVEPSEEMAKRAEQRGVQVYREKGEALSLEDNSVDLVVMITVDCFLDSLKQTLEEAYRILSPGGALVVGFIDKTAPLGKVYEEKKHHNEFYKYAKFHSGVEMIAALGEAGFKSLKTGQTIFTLKNEYQESKPGLGQGLFGVIRGEKQ
jgi:SAM-dependent methyltransferase